MTAALCVIQVWFEKPDMGENSDVNDIEGRKNGFQSFEHAAADIGTQYVIRFMYFFWILLLNLPSACSELQFFWHTDSPVLGRSQNQGVQYRRR